MDQSKKNSLIGSLLIGLSWKVVLLMSFNFVALSLDASFNSLTKCGLSIRFHVAVLVESVSESKESPGVVVYNFYPIFSIEKIFQLVS